MKTVKFKNTVLINCHVWNGHEFIKEQREGVKIDQMLMNGHEFYVTKTPDKYDDLIGYNLTEYSTGFCLNGTYPEKTANKAAQWLQLRFEGKGSHFIIKCIQEMLTKYGRVNGIEKQYLIDGKTVSYSNLPEIGADSTECFDLDTIPCPYTYYLENGLTVKRII